MSFELWLETKKCWLLAKTIFAIALKMQQVFFGLYIFSFGLCFMLLSDTAIFFADISVVFGKAKEKQGKIHTMFF